MWIQVRTIDCKKTVRVDKLSKLTKIEDLRERLVEHFDAEPCSQRLFFRGKQLEDGHTLFDYDVGLNDLIQLLIRSSAPQPESEGTSADSATEQAAEADKVKEGAEDNFSDKDNKEPDSDAEACQPSTSVLCLDQDEGNIYKVGDVIDARDPTMGAWFEAKILEVYREKSGGQQPSRTVQAGTAAMDTDRPAGAENKASDQKSEDSDSKCSDDGNNKIRMVPQDAERSGTSCDSDDQENVKQTAGRCSTPKKSDSSTKDNENVSQADETDGMSSGCQKSETGTVLTPKKISTSKENVGEKTATSRSLFVKEVSDDLKKKGILCETIVTDGFIYKVVFDGYEDDVALELDSKSIRPRARHLLRFEDVKIGQTILANYNYEEPASRGFWYDCVVTEKKEVTVKKAKPELYATVYLGADLLPLENCRLHFLAELFDIEKPGTQLCELDAQMDPSAFPAKRQNKPNCDHCKDNMRRKCKECGCCVCGGKHDPHLQLMCDECDKAYHLQCLNPPLCAVPTEDDWYCPECKRDENEVVKAGEKLKESKKKSKMASASSSTSRDWGKGMACVGRTKQCTIVPSNHYGPIPGVEVGTMWKFRVQVSEAGVHRPHVAGIHGREDDGAYSIVLSGGYEDDTDNGDEFYYTGSGGRDLSGNKRTAEQSCDQKLTRVNKALAKNCNVPIESKKGAEAKDWRGGKPVRVVRNCKGRKHSEYAPEEGNRYDGIYKVVKYWAEKGKSGFLVWRYLLRRDDPAPAPWTKEGTKRIQELGLTMQYPEGYMGSTTEKEDSEEDHPKKKRGRKRKAEDSPEAETQDTKKSKTAAFKVDKDIMKLIKEDSVNQKLWDEALKHTSEGKQEFLRCLTEVFMCICCQEIVYKPVSLQCSHNFCKPCLSRSFKADMFTCPTCRQDLPKDYSLPVNSTLRKILNHYCPGYEAGRE